jgi:hypothetical protein
MKKYLLITGIILTTFIFVTGETLAQMKEEDRPKEPPTKLEAFLAKKGKLVIKDSYELGELRKLGTVTFDALVLYEPGMEAQKIKGIRVEITEPGRVERKRISFLDLDEIESASKAISYMADLAEKWRGQTREAYTEVTFSTKGDFKVGFFQKGQKRSLYLYAGYVAQASSFMEVEDFPALKNILDKGLSLLRQK